MTDDHLTAYAEHLDREPVCTCTDTSVCDLHEPAPTAAGAGEEGTR